MATIYFFVFCMAVAYVIYWAVRNDDFSEFYNNDTIDKREEGGNTHSSDKINIDLK